MNYKNALDSFAKSGKEFTLVYKSVKFTTPVSRILILDSSFNPPHVAHQTLAQEAIAYDFGETHETEKHENASKSLLLLLSVKNADKIVPAPASFEHRLAMMHLMANSLENSYIDVGIGLTTHAKFADKSAAIQEYMETNFSWKKPARLTFLLGFDTLVRVLDPKYYAPATLADSLNNFMYNTDLFCLTRAENKTEFEEQKQYIEKIGNAEFPEIPRSWAKNVHLKSLRDNRDSVGAISSSAVRKAYETHESPENIPLLPEIDAYIRENRLYGKKR
ncbi:hypothetical protein OXX69_000635 [Metschnikowia pulcherrima]